LKKNNLFLLTFALSLGTFIQVLDFSITNVAIPDIAGDLGAGPVEGTWVITSYAASNAVVLLLTGWLSKRFGEVRLFLYSILLFSLTSGLCGLARDLTTLIVFRVLQGLAGGALIPLSQSLIYQSYPLEKRGLGLGLWAMIVVVAPILGPILGGYITYNYTWPWIFYINIPLGLLSAVMIALLLDIKSEKREKQRLDIVNFSLLTISIGCLQSMLDQGNNLDWFSSPTIITLAIISALTFCFWLAWNYYSANPLVDFSLFKRRTFAIAMVQASLSFMIFYGSFVVIPLWLQLEMGYTSYLAGLATCSSGLVSVILTPIIGHFLHRLDLRIWVSLGFFAFALVYYWSLTLNTEVTLGYIFMLRLFMGFGTSLFFLPLSALALSGLPDHRLSSASGLFNFLRTIAGGGFGTSLAVTFWRRRESYYHTMLGEAVTPSRQAATGFLDQLDTLGIKDGAATQMTQNILEQQTYMLSLNDIFWISAWAFLLMIPFLWVAKRATVGSAERRTQNAE
jgi:DHA2 family multidrug resistance protein